MKTAVIYARYSCDKQTEQSIEGQLRVCQDYAKSHDILIIDTYIDQAISGTTDNRPDFQRMIKDSAKKTFELVLVYKLDRKLVIDEERAETVRFMYAEFSKGIIVKDIIKELTAMGKTYRGKPFAMNTVYNILRNEKYIGIYRINDEVLTNMYPQIVDKNIYNRVNAILKRNKRGSRSVETNYLLKHNMLYANGQ